VPRYAIIIDAKKCVGCYACQVACQMQNELLPENAFIRFEDRETGKYPQPSYIIVPLQCQHCQDAPCVAVCPTTASHKDGSGLTQVDRDKCMGCRRCVAACPYNARTYLAADGVAQACNMCLSLVTAGEEPACVATCLTKARVFGDLDDPRGDFAGYLAKAKPLRPDFGTRPTLLYIL
jgi:Fe-S-cluster-containing dehydrogenase component